MKNILESESGCNLPPSYWESESEMDPWLIKVNLIHFEVKGPDFSNMGCMGLRMVLLIHFNWSLMLSIPLLPVDAPITIVLQ